MSFLNNFVLISSLKYKSQSIFTIEVLDNQTEKDKIASSHSLSQVHQYNYIDVHNENLSLFQQEGRGFHLLVHSYLF